MTCDIFIKSYPPDFEYLAYCLRSIQKFTSGFRSILVAVPPGHGLKLTRETIVEIPVPESYMAQQVAKLNADRHTDADFILHIDSDCVLQIPVTPETFMEKGRPRWLITPWSECMDAKRVWYHVLAKCCQQCPEFEFMRRNTIMVPRFAYAAFREFIQVTHAVTMDRYVMNQPGREFSEYNTLGFYLWLYHRDKIAWHDTSVMGVPENWVNQEWSWAGLDIATRAKIEDILK